jgi:hypothetical protein
MVSIIWLLETVVTKVHEPFSTLFHYFSQHDSRGNKDWLVIFLLPADKIVTCCPVSPPSHRAKTLPPGQSESLENVALPVRAHHGSAGGYVDGVADRGPSESATEIGSGGSSSQTPVAGL